MKFITILMTCAFALAGEKVGNGEGLGEQRITSSNEYLSFYLNFCLKGGCMMNKLELEYAGSLLKARQANPKFEFVSAKKEPGVFSASGFAAFVHTDKTSYGLVKINLDRLYSNSMALSQEHALGLVIDVYNYKLGSAVPEAFKQKMNVSLAKNVTTIQHSFDHSYLKLTLYKSNTEAQRSLFVNDEETSVNIHGPLAAYFNCKPDQHLSIRRVSWSSHHPVGVSVSGINTCQGQTPFEVTVSLKYLVSGGGIPGWLKKIKLVEKDSIETITLH